MQYKKKRHPLCAILFIAAAIITSIHLINRFIFFFAQKDTKKEAGNFTFPWKYGTIHYTVRGSGSPLLLIHDLRVGNSRREWHRIRDYYAESHKVYSIDLLGCGFSERPAMTYSNYLYVQLLTDFVKTVIGSSCDVAASGLSCTFVTMANKMDDSLFNRLIFVNPISVKDSKKTPDSIKNKIKTVLELPVFGTFLYNLAFNREQLKKTVSQEFINQSLAESYADGMYENAHKQNGNDRYLYASLYSDFLTINIEGAIRQLEKPLLLIFGSKVAHGAAVIEEYTNLNSAIKTATISGARNYPHIERFPRVGKAMDNFLI